jgi:hypothetical protein
VLARVAGAGPVSLCSWAEFIDSGPVLLIVSVFLLPDSL